MEKRKMAITLIVLAVVIAIITVGISMSDNSSENIETGGQGSQGEVSFEMAPQPNETNSEENTQNLENGSG